MTQVIAHRGFSGRYPENTLAAIRAAIRLGVDMVEIDVHQTADGQLIVFHDFALDRLCGVTGRVEKTTAARIRQLNPAVPTLARVLKACRGKVRLLIEVKRADPGNVAAQIRAAGMTRHVIVFSFSTVWLARFARVAPDIARFGLFDRIQGRLKCPEAGLGLSAKLVRSRRRVQQLRRRWKLFIWTVDDPRAMRRYLDWGVDGLITNHPDRALAVVRARQ